MIGPEKKCWAILLAAGAGSRFKSDPDALPKQFLPFRNQPLYWHSAIKLARTALLEGIVFVFPKKNFNEHVAALNELCANNELGISRKVVMGGATRKDSAFEGLSALPADASFVIIHDAARPFFNPAIIEQILSRLYAGAKAVAPGVPVADTIKILRPDRPSIVEKTLPRKRLISVQTPQGFLTEALLSAHNQYWDEEITDDAMLMELSGHQVETVEGNDENKKMTIAADEIYLRNREQERDLYSLPCSGLGYDVHRFGGGKPIKLGGVEIPSAQGIIAHSDGDVLLHALIDGILGCACMGDIGLHFPDSEEKFKDISSAALLRRVLDLTEDKIRIYQADLVLVAQEPRINKFREAIRLNIARLLSIDESWVNIKATTEEGLGYTGAMQGIKAYALVNAWRKKTVE